MTLAIIRKICMVSLPILLTVSSLLHFIYMDNQWFEYFYIVSLTANIGYFTNYVAIKMLFKPYNKTAFGRQGLIPKNQKKLANSLSETLIDNFLSANQWREYLINSNLINRVLSEAKQSSRDWLSEAKNIEKISLFLTNYLRENQSSINNKISILQQQMVSKFSDQVDPQELLGEGFSWLEEQFETNPDQMHNMIEPIIKTLAENIPDIADSLVEALDDHIEEQDTIKRGIAKMAHWSSDFSSDDIRQYLFRMVASFEFRETLFDGLKTLLAEYKDKPFVLQESTESTDLVIEKQISISSVLSNIISANLDQIDWVDIFIQKVLDDDNLAEIQKITYSLHSEIFTKIESELNDGPLHSWLIDELISMIEKLDLRQMVKNKAADFSPQKIESVFQNMISEQLVFIELLGAVLGALSGLALIDIRVFAVLTGIFVSYYLADSFFTRIQFHRSSSLDSQEVSVGTDREA